MKERYGGWSEKVCSPFKQDAQKEDWGRDRIETDNGWQSTFDQKVKNSSESQARIIVKPIHR